MNKVINQNKKLAREVGTEESSHFIVNDNATTQLLTEEIKQEYNEKVDEYVGKLDSHTNLLEEYATQFNDSIGDMEIKAIGNNMIVMPFETNPFQKIKTTDSGLILNTGGLTPEYKSNESGEIEEEKPFVIPATVIDAGPDCKWVKEGDVVMYTITSVTPIPFFNQNIYYMNESRVMCVINANLTERFKK